MLRPAFDRDLGMNGLCEGFGFPPQQRKASWADLLWPHGTPPGGIKLWKFGGMLC